MWTSFLLAALSTVSAAPAGSSKAEAGEAKGYQPLFTGYDRSYPLTADQGYMKTFALSSYNYKICAAYCSAAKNCESFNIYQSNDANQCAIFSQVHRQSEATHPGVANSAYYIKNGYGVTPSNKKVNTKSAEVSGTASAAADKSKATTDASKQSVKPGVSSKAVESKPSETKAVQPVAAETHASESTKATAGASTAASDPKASPAIGNKAGSAAQPSPAAASAPAAAAKPESQNAQAPGTAAAAKASGTAVADASKDKSKTNNGNNAQATSKAAETKASKSEDAKATKSEASKSADAKATASEKSKTNNGVGLTKTEAAKPAGTDAPKAAGTDAPKAAGTDAPKSKTNNGVNETKSSQTAQTPKATSK